jgi:putative ABC transport system permease protein
MPVLLKIALRNLGWHKVKTLIVGSLLALGVLVVSLGNAFMDTANRGVRSSVIEHVTGDLVFHGASKYPVSIFGAESMSLDADDTLPLLDSYPELVQKLQDDPRVSGFSGMVSAMGFLGSDVDETMEEVTGDDPDTMVFGLICGIDAERWFTLFPAIELIEGRLLEGTERGILIDEKQYEKLQKKYGGKLVVGDNVVVHGASSSGLRMRELPLLGVVKQSVFSPIPLMYTDADSARSLAGLIVGSDAPVELSAADTDLLSASSLDDLFSFDDEAFGVSVSESDFSLDFDNPASIIGDTSGREALNRPDTGAWNFVLVRLAQPSSAAALRSEWRSWLREQESGDKIVDWKTASGSLGSMVDLLRISLSGALILIAIVAVIIMMNTLLISVMERTSEIGTMRALGGQRDFVRRLILTETMVLAVSFGLGAWLLSAVVVFVLNALHIQPSGELARMFLGGEHLKLGLPLSSLPLSLLMVSAVALIAALFPVSLALKVSPLEAMRDE